MLPAGLVSPPTQPVVEAHGSLCQPPGMGSFLAWVGSGFLPQDLFQSLQNLPSSHSGCLGRREPLVGGFGVPASCPERARLCGLSTQLTREPSLAAPLTVL